MSVRDPTEAAERFVEKWSASELSERAASHEHVIDLCRLIQKSQRRRNYNHSEKRIAAT